VQKKKRISASLPNFCFQGGKKLPVAQKNLFSIRSPSRLFKSYFAAVWCPPYLRHLRNIWEGVTWTTIKGAHRSLLVVWLRQKGVGNIIVRKSIKIVVDLTGTVPFYLWSSFRSVSRLVLVINICITSLCTYSQAIFVNALHRCGKRCCAFTRVCSVATCLMERSCSRPGKFSTEQAGQTFISCIGTLDVRVHCLCSFALAKDI
jgi:hypothetical protein